MNEHGWGPWWLNARNYTLALGKYERYYVDLEDCTTSAEVLDWIAQLADKDWATPDVLAGVVQALDDVLRLQATLCGCGVGKRLSRRAIRSMTDSFAFEHPELVRPTDWDVYGRVSA